MQSNWDGTDGNPAAVLVMRSCVVGLIGLLVLGDASAQVLTDPRVVDQLKAKPAPNPESATGVVAPSATSAAAERVPSANPLWTIPLTSFTATRERPLFSPSRRPPPPVVVAKAPPPPPPPPPPKPAEPEVSLVGTILGENGERIGLFVNPADKNPLRLKIGEDHKGWILRSVLPRQVVLEKGQQIAVLELPQRDVRTGRFSPPPPSVEPAFATHVAEPLAANPPQPIVNPFAENQLPPPPPPPVNPFADHFQKARLR